MVMPMMMLMLMPTAMMLSYVFVSWLA